jgi:hypothetical protein
MYPDFVGFSSIAGLKNNLYWLVLRVKSKKEPNEQPSSGNVVTYMTCAQMEQNFSQKVQSGSSIYILWHRYTLQIIWQFALV